MCVCAIHTAMWYIKKREDSGITKEIEVSGGGGVQKIKTYSDLPIFLKNISPLKCDLLINYGQDSLVTKHLT